MAKLTLNFISESLYRAIPLEIIIPTDHMVQRDLPKPEYNKPYRTMYYLEGLLGNASGPANYTRLQAFAEDYNTVVVVVGGENAWYCDSKYTGNYYATMVCKDLINFTRRFLNISHKREDTGIMGFSMGGHGALTIGLAHPEIFGNICCFDGAFHQQVWLDAPDDPTWDCVTRRMYMNMLGVDKMEDFLGGPNDLDASAEKTIKTDIAPRIFIACGSEDAPQYPGNKMWADKLQQMGYDCTWKEVEGGAHSNWTVDHCVEMAFEWFNKEDSFEQNMHHAGKAADLNAMNFANWKTMYNVEAGDTSEYRFLYKNY